MALADISIKVDKLKALTEMSSGGFIFLVAARARNREALLLVAREPFCLDLDLAGASARICSEQPALFRPTANENRFLVM